MISPIVYHGTFENFEKFDKSKLGSNTESPSAYQGFFFASNKKVAISHVSKILKKLKNCIEIKDHVIDEVKKLTGDSYIDSLIKYMRHEYDDSIDKKLFDLYKMISICNDYEAGLIDFPIAYDSDLDEPIIRQVRLHFKNPFIHDMRGKDYRDIDYIYLIISKKLKTQNGKKPLLDGIIIKNTYDGGNPAGKLEPTDIYVAFDESQIEEIDNDNDNN